MKRSIWAFLFFLGAGTVAQAVTNPPVLFNKPPELYASVWQTAPPYQRNINMGFTVNPVGPAGSGIPGAYYSGTLDPSLRVSDYVQFTGPVGWYSTLPGYGGTGVIALDNRSGSGWANGTAAFHIDNTLVNQPQKHVWLEYDCYVPPGTNFLIVSVVGSTGGQWPRLGNPIYTDLGNGFARWDVEYGTSPNPAWETITFSFWTEPGQIVGLDNLHIATECVPEPSVFALLALGTAALLISRRRN